MQFYYTIEWGAHYVQSLAMLQGRARKKNYLMLNQGHGHYSLRCHSLANWKAFKVSLRGGDRGITTLCEAFIHLMLVLLLLLLLRLHGRVLWQLLNQIIYEWNKIESEVAAFYEGALPRWPGIILDPVKTATGIFIVMQTSCAALMYSDGSSGSNWGERKASA